MSRTPSAPPYSGIVFDCDSTLATIEGIEELGEGCSDEVRARIADLTNEAMEGRLPLQDAYGARLEALKPTREKIDLVGDLYVQNALPNARALMDALQFLGKHVAVVSGGLLAPVQHLSKHLGIDPSHAQAVDLRFNEDGSYAGFDETSPLARSGGKLDVIGTIAEQHGPLALIGDGATDLEAAPVCARFIAFAGVEARPTVMQAADEVCVDADLAALLPLLCTDEEQTRLANHPDHAALISAAKTLSPKS
ncbi:MAG: HAD-IB family phosphatase [bacterium]|nr:HAD-IB family phosphatase [bacterium]